MADPALYQDTEKMLEVQRQYNEKENWIPPMKCG